MPISTDYEGWRDGEVIEGVPKLILDFLNEHPDKAFHYRELADEVIETSWQEIHDEEWHPPLSWFGDPEEIFSEEMSDEQEKIAQAIMDQVQTVRVMGAADQLVYEGLLEKRLVSAEDTNLPYEDWDTVVFYSVS